MTADDVLEHCRERLAGYKRPRSATIVSARATPRARCSSTHCASRIGKAVSGRSEHTSLPTFGSIRRRVCPLAALQAMVNAEWTSAPRPNPHRLQAFATGGVARGTWFRSATCASLPAPAPRPTHCPGDERSIGRATAPLLRVNVLVPAELTARSLPPRPLRVLVAQKTSGPFERRDALHAKSRGAAPVQSFVSQLADQRR